MSEIKFPAWDSDIEEIEKEINRMNNRLTNRTKLLKKEVISEQQYKDLIEDIITTLRFWTGRTPIGERKSEVIQKRFQTFFEKLYEFLIVCKNSSLWEPQNLANDSLYQGTLYRYLGYGPNITGEKVQIKPKFDNIYASWSKLPQNSYIESKLHGPKTWLECKVEGNLYGIDLTVFGVSKANEEEVVFPTIEKTILDIRYLK